MRRVWTAALAALVLGLALPASPAVAGDPPVRLPSSPTGLRSPVTLPSGVDPASPYLPQVACSPVDTPGAVKVLGVLKATYGYGGSIHRGCTDGLSEHSEGRAIDWMVDTRVTAQKRAAADFLAWATRDGGRNARRLGIMYLIYNQKIWAVYRADEGWRPSSGHQDHVHISLSWNGARGNVSFWTGTVGTIDRGPCVAFAGTYAVLTSTPRTGACPPAVTPLKGTSLGTRVYGQSGATVALAQDRLGVRRTSRFDGPTWTAVKAYQAAHDIPRTGVLDQPTWASLGPASRVTTDAVAGLSSQDAAGEGLAQHAGVPLARGGLGRAVLVLQTALAMPAADRNGSFGPVTQAAVEQLQRDAGLAVDGVVGAEEWQALVDRLG